MSIRNAARSLSQSLRLKLGDDAEHLSSLYGHALNYRGPERNPVVLIPGILGSKLTTRSTGKSIWGAFDGDYVDPGTPEGARQCALPMREGATLRELVDDVEPVGVLDHLKFGLLGLPVQLSAYVDIIHTLAVGGYSDETCEQMERDGSIDDEPGRDRDAFKFAWDWRRDLSESAAKLHEYILRRREYVCGCRDDEHVRFDIVAHSMGGMLARYYMMYGPEPLPTEGPVPPPTWEGARHIDRLIIVGSPGAGSVAALRELVSGKKVSVSLPFYDPAILGSHPGIYQLIPPTPFGRIVDEAGNPIDIYDAAEWEKRGWGLADEQQDEVLEKLMPSEPKIVRRRIALDHLRKCLDAARRLHEALGHDCRPPERDGHRPSIHLIAGDLHETACVMQASDDGSLTVVGTSPGDGVVTRASALLDRRISQPKEDRPLRLDSPVTWSSIRFMPGDHMGMTKHPLFVDNLLHLLLEDPRG